VFVRVEERGLSRDRRSLLRGRGGAWAIPLGDRGRKPTAPVRVGGRGWPRRHPGVKQAVTW
jgi:hypothetical protein